MCFITTFKNGSIKIEKMGSRKTVDADLYFMVFLSSKQWFLNG